MTMSETLVKFRKLTQVFDPIYRPYGDPDDGPGATYVQEAHEDYRKSLVQALELNDQVEQVLRQTRSRLNGRKIAPERSVCLLVATAGAIIVAAKRGLHGTHDDAGN